MFKFARHSAAVVSYDGRDIIVILDGESSGSCAGCGIALFCRRDTCRRITLRNPGGRVYRPGDRVEVCAAGSLKHLALMVFFVIPLVLMLIAAVTLDYVGAGQEWCALGGVGALVFWYLILFVFRRRIERMCRWRLLPSD